MSDAGIGSTLPALDASTVAKAGGRSGKKETADTTENFGSALDRVRVGGRPAPEQRAGAKDEQSPDTEAAPDDIMPQYDVDDMDSNGGVTNARSGRPMIDIRAAIRQDAPKAGRDAGSLSAAAGDQAPVDDLVFGQATKAAGDPRLARVGNRAADAPQAMAAQAGDDGQGDEPHKDKPATARAEHDDLRLWTLRKPSVAKGKAAADDDADADLDAKVTAPVGKGVEKGLSLETDPLTAQDTKDQPADGPQANTEDGSDLPAPVAMPAQAAAHVHANAHAKAQAQDPPNAALQMDGVMPKSQKAGGALDPIGRQGEETGPAREKAVSDGDDSAVKQEAPVERDRIFRFSRADGKGQSMDMVIGSREKAGQTREARHMPVETVTVLDSRRYLALAPNSNTVVSALSGNREWASAMQADSALSNAASQASTGKVVNTLKIQIHPMTLGAVTATMRLSGDELTVSLQVETVAAYRQLSDDQRGIVESLRAHGFTVDQVSVTLVSAPDKADSANAQGNGQSAASGQQSAQDGNASSRRDDRHAMQQNGRNGAERREETAGGNAGGAGGRTGQLYL